jgi:hypothetical protein
VDNFELQVNTHRTLSPKTLRALAASVNIFVINSVEVAPILFTKTVDVMY